MEAAIFGPKEEPDGRKDKGSAEDGEEGEEAAVVDVVRIDGACAGTVVGVFWRGGRGKGASS